jgi:hypothetical protein
MLRAKWRRGNSQILTTGGGGFRNTVSKQERDRRTGNNIEREEGGRQSCGRCGSVVCVLDAAGVAEKMAENAPLKRAREGLTW